jgi:hypothetical protein
MDFFPHLRGGWIKSYEIDSKQKKPDESPNLPMDFKKFRLQTESL